MRVSIFGLGYVGCVSLGCLAESGHNVIGVDVNQHKVNLINNGKPTIIEKDIDQLILKGFKSGKISATSDYIKAVKQTDVSLICVGTPSSNEGHLNLDYIYKVAQEIAEGIKRKNDFVFISQLAYFHISTSISAMPATFPSCKVYYIQKIIHKPTN